MLANRVRIGRKKEGNEYIGEVYLAQDDDFGKVINRLVYRGSELEIEIPHIIQGEKVTSYGYMFCGVGSYLATPVTRVDSNNKSVTDMSNMFNGSQATTLDLSSFDTSNVTNMSSMFRNSSATTGYARTQADADRFNNSSNKPSTLVFVVK